MLMLKSSLTSLPDEPPEFEAPHHLTRWQTLKALQAACQKTPERFCTVEICVWAAERPTANTSGVVIRDARPDRNR